MLEETLERLFEGRWDALDLDGPVITVDTDTTPYSESLVEDVARQVLHGND